jgi:hypothetical protein
VTRDWYEQALNDAVGGGPVGLQLQPSGHFVRLSRQQRQQQQQQHHHMIIINFDDVCIVWTPQGFLPALKEVFFQTQTPSKNRNPNLVPSLAILTLAQQAIIIAQQLRSSSSPPLPALLFPPLTAHQSTLPWYDPPPSPMPYICS